ncbi:MAG: hemerythrin family protein [Desulfuromonadales bacterium]|nr:hemerythrin family protein [Desulfuromonadales bacterium]
MQLLVWESRFNLGIKTFDNHHKRLVEIINNSYRAVQHNSTHRIIILLDELFDYAMYHFFAEEQLMRTHSDPALKDHSREHEEFLFHISAFKKSMTSKEPLYKVPVVVFLKEWFISHVLVVDREYVRLFDNKSKT